MEFDLDKSVISGVTRVYRQPGRLRQSEFVQRRECPVVEMGELRLTATGNQKRKKGYRPDRYDRTLTPSHDELIPDFFNDRREFRNAGLHDQVNDIGCGYTGNKNKNDGSGVQRGDDGPE